MNVTRSPRSYNSQIGVPLSVWLLDESSQIGVFEAGISDPGEMDALRDIIQPTIGIMVNLGNAHQENFPDKESKCREKLKLFKNCDVVIYSSDDEIIDRSISIGKIAHQQLRWSVKDDSAPLFVSSIENHKTPQLFHISMTDMKGNILCHLLTTPPLPTAFIAWLLVYI